MKPETNSLYSKEKHVRSTNIILHGVNEVVDKNKESIEEGFGAFIETIGIGNKPESIICLGQPELRKCNQEGTQHVSRKTNSLKCKT